MISFDLLICVFQLSCGVSDPLFVCSKPARGHILSDRDQQFKKVGSAVGSVGGS